MAAYQARARFRLNAANSGAVPAYALEEITGLQLPITFNGGGSWGSNAGGNGLLFTALPDADPAMEVVAPLNGTALATALNGNNEFSFFFEFTATAVVDGSRVFTIGDDTSGGKLGISFTGASGFNVRYNNDGGPGVSFFDVGPAEVPTLTNNNRRIVVVSIDATGTEQPTIVVKVDDVTLPPQYSEAVAAVLQTIGEGDYIQIGNHPWGTLGITGMISYLEIGTGLLTPAEATLIYTNLLANNDANPLVAPTLDWVSVPAITGGTITSSGGQIQLTTNIPATVKLLDTAAGSTEPDPSEFTALPSLGTTVANTQFTYSVTGQTAETTRRKWIQISDGTTTLYEYVDLTTTAESGGGDPEIVSVTCPNTFRRGVNVNIDVTTNELVPTLGNTTVTINGVSMNIVDITGSGPYTITAQVGSGTVLKYSTVGYDCVITIDTEVHTEPNVAFLPPVGSNFVDITTVETSVGRVFYLGTEPPQVNSQVEWTIVNGTGNLNITNAGVWEWATRPTGTVIVAYRYIEPDGTIHAPVQHTYTI